MQKSKETSKWIFRTNPVSKAYAAQMVKPVCVPANACLIAI